MTVSSTDDSASSDIEPPLQMGGLTRAHWAAEGVRQAASTLLIWAGPAQVLFFGAVAQHVAPAAIAFSICVSSMRLLPMCLSLLPLLRGRRTSLLTLVVASHFVAVTVWTESMRRIHDVPRDARMAFYFGFAHACILATAAFTGLGYWLMGDLPTPLGAGLLFLSPIYFITALARNAREAMDWLAIGFGLVLAPVTGALAPRGFDLLFLGVVGGTAAWAIGRKLRARRGETA